jgi:hypothetical protein
MALLAAPAFSQPAAPVAYQHAATGLAFPTTLGPMKYLGVVDYAQKGRPDLGVGVRYRQGRTWVDIYLYDLGKKNLGTGLGSPEVRQAFNSAVEEVFEMERRQQYRDVKKTGAGEATLATAAGPLPMLRAGFAYERLPGPNISDPGPLVSDLFITAYKDSFLKIRFSSPASLQERHQAMVKQFLESLGKILK